jgi:putative ABC transport system substrate-binding protein
VLVFGIGLAGLDPAIHVLDPALNKDTNAGSTGHKGMGEMRRRDFIALAGVAAASRPLAARAQQTMMPVIGFLNSGSAHLFSRFVGAFHEGLSETGFVEGRNVAVEYRWAEGRYDRLPELAAELVSRQVNVIAATGGNPSALAAKAATANIPIVFNMGDDPVRAGVVASLNRPGGNLTGVSMLNTELLPKQLQVLHELVPSATIIGLLVNPTGPNAETVSTGLRGAAETLGLQLHTVHASAEMDFDTVFANLGRLPVGALVIAPDPFYTSRLEQLATLSIRHSIPAIYSNREFCVAGGLINYGIHIAGVYRLVGVYVGRILKGAKPADLPVEQFSKVELVINLKTAKALGLTVPQSLLARADEVIE